MLAVYDQPAERRNVHSNTHSKTDYERLAGQNPIPFENRPLHHENQCHFTDYCPIEG